MIGFTFSLGGLFSVLFSYVMFGYVMFGYVMFSYVMFSHVMFSHVMFSHVMFILYFGAGYFVREMMGTRVLFDITTSVPKSHIQISMGYPLARDIKTSGHIHGHPKVPN